ncbi:hypothetical protein JHK86_043705 [Glycine max]|nr:hypothetical protein JHK86_043705 [Glycine max]
MEWEHMDRRWSRIFGDIMHMSCVKIVLSPSHSELNTAIVIHKISIANLTSPDGLLKFNELAGRRLEKDAHEPVWPGANQPVLEKLATWNGLKTRSRLNIEWSQDLRADPRNPTTTEDAKYLRDSDHGGSDESKT